MKKLITKVIFVGRRWHAPADVVADQAEARRLGVVLHDATKRRLRVVRHRVGFVKHNELVRRTRIFRAKLFVRVRVTRQTKRRKIAKRTQPVWPRRTIARNS